MIKVENAVERYYWRAVTFLRDTDFSGGRLLGSAEVRACGVPRQTGSYRCTERQKSAKSNDKAGSRK